MNKLFTILATSAIAATSLMAISPAKAGPAVTNTLMNQLKVESLPNVIELEAKGSQVGLSYNNATTITTTPSIDATGAITAGAITLGAGSGSIDVSSYVLDTGAATAGTISVAGTGNMVDKTVNGFGIQKISTGGVTTAATFSVSPLDVPGKTIAMPTQQPTGVNVSGMNMNSLTVFGQ